MNFSRKYANKIKRKIAILAFGSIAVICAALSVFNDWHYRSSVTEVNEEILAANEKVISLSNNEYNKITTGAETVSAVSALSVGEARLYENHVCYQRMRSVHQNRRIGRCSRFAPAGTRCQGT